MERKTVRKLPIGVQNFESLRKDGYLYVDKTKYIYELVHASKQYFLSRPRRFGKSLFLSTLRAYWEGKKELFDGLDIVTLEADNPEAWQAYPVFYFDFNKDNFRRETALDDVLDTHLKKWEQAYGCDAGDASLAARFQNLLETAAEQTGKRCVVLVDEYDKSLLETIQNPAVAEHNKAVFKGFFSTLKSYDGYLQFVFITGVTKFSKVSIFSDLNQMEDISMDADYDAICGITEEELAGNFAKEIAVMAQKQGLTVEGCLSKLRETYDGYHFHPYGAGVYNPFSLLNALKKREFDSFWFETGTPSFLVNKIRKTDFDARKFTDHTLYSSKRNLSEYRADNPDPVPLLYQTGYLTIAEYDPVGQMCTLMFPNAEVKYGFLESLAPAYMTGFSAGAGNNIFALRKHIENGDLDGVRDILTALFAGIPYTDNAKAPFEHYFQSVIFIVFTLLGQMVKCEAHSSRGRADCIVETKDYVYIFEFKLDKSAEEALAQIEEKQYALPYAADARTLYKIGVSFASASRSLAEWKAESR